MFFMKKEYFYNVKLNNILPIRINIIAQWTSNYHLQPNPFSDNDINFQKSEWSFIIIINPLVLIWHWWSCKLNIFHSLLLKTHTKLDNPVWFSSHTMWSDETLFIAYHKHKLTPRLSALIGLMFQIVYLFARLW